MPLSVAVALTAPESVLFHVQLANFPLLACVYGLANALRGVRGSRSRSDGTVPTARGPGGRPLPSNRRPPRSSAANNDDALEECFGRVACNVFVYVTICIVLSFAADAVAITAHTLSGEADGGWWCGEETACYLIGGLFMHLFVWIMLFMRGKGPNSSEFSVWAVALVTEVSMLTASYVRVHGPHTVLQNVARFEWIVQDEPDQWDYVGLGIASARVALLTFLVGLYLVLSMKQRISNQEKLEEEARGSDDDESTPLLLRAAALRARHGTHTDQGCQYRDDDAAFYRPEKLPHKSWWEYIRGYSLFFPYLWPANKPRLQAVVFVSVIILILQRIVNFMVPNQIGIVTDALKNSHGKMPWTDMMWLIVYKLNQGTSGLLGSIRGLLWIPVSQFAYRSLTTAAFEHVHSLSLDFHLGKRTGEVLSALNKGASINTFLEQVTFQVFPMLIDLIIAIIYFQVRFGPVYATIATVITWYYLAMTVMMAATRTGERRDMVNADREEEAIKNDSIISYETVKYFNAERYEFDRYRGAVRDFQAAEAKVTWGMNNMNICQSLVFMCGLLIMLVVAAYEVTQATLSVGDFVVMITYLGQLQGPLNFFGTFYRTVQQSMISGERLLELFKIRPSVTDRSGVPPLATSRGHIRWNNVDFSYDPMRTALEDLTFECVPGTTTAFVGESGGGKSTIFRLMFRYYNCQSGSIEIDGCNVKDVSIDSVRRLIGVVPQDTILFNESIMYNLKYANQGVTEDEVHEACRAASIHDRIQSFPEGYNTKVGDRGLRLSGGEKQRVAIARAILKRPKIIMLDEATSALDSETEQQIQKKLIRGSDLGQDRTLLIIAHRLSTITHADQILVLHSGKIVERGTHNTLLAMGGRYTSMWEKQSQAEAAAEQARNATARAQRLLKQAHLTGDKQVAEDGSDGYHSMSSSTVLQTGPPTPGVASPPRSEASSDDDEESKSTIRIAPEAKSPIKETSMTEGLVEDALELEGSSEHTLFEAERQYALAQELPFEPQDVGTVETADSEVMSTDPAGEALQSKPTEDQSSTQPSIGDVPKSSSSV